MQVKENPQSVIKSGTPYHSTDLFSGSNYQISSFYFIFFDDYSFI